MQGSVDSGLGRVSGVGLGGHGFGWDLCQEGWNGQDTVEG